MVPPCVSSDSGRGRQGLTGNGGVQWISSAGKPTGSIMAAPSPSASRLHDPKRSFSSLFLIDKRKRTHNGTSGIVAFNITTGCIQNECL